MDLNYFIIVYLLMNNFFFLLEITSTEKVNKRFFIES